MVTPNIINKVGDKITWRVRVTNGPTSNTGVSAELTVPAEFIILDYTSTEGSLTGTTWDIGDMVAEQVSTIFLTLELTGTPVSFNETYTLSAEVFGLDTVLTNNVLTDLVQYSVDTSVPLAGGELDETSNLTVDVSENDTSCSFGVTEWRLNETSLTNGTLVSWDVLTGKGIFTRVDPTLPITFTYDIYCTADSTDYEAVNDIEVTIHPSLVSKNVFDHTISHVKGSDLTTGDITVLEVQYPDLGDVTLFDWHLLYNAEGELTSGSYIESYRNIEGYICEGNGTGRLLFVIMDKGVISYEYPDGTSYSGVLGDLEKCCCNE